eukprot:3296546-Prymnesium_polylepis.1
MRCPSCRCPWHDSSPFRASSPSPGAFRATRGLRSFPTALAWARLYSSSWQPSEAHVARGLQSIDTEDPGHLASR